jgi:hypothetical protein
VPSTLPSCVSARPDTFREAAWKLLKRNKAISAVTAAAVLLLSFVLVRSSWANYQARRETEQAYQAYRDQVKQSVPAFVRSARLSVNEGDFDDALGQIDVAVQADPEHATARLLRAELRVAQQQFEAAAEDLEKYLEQRPDHAGAAQLRELCRTAKADDVPTLNAFYKVFYDNKRFVLADRVTHLTERVVKAQQDLVKARQELLGVYRQRIEAAWPKRGDTIRLDENGRFHLVYTDNQEVQDLTPLTGMQLTTLDLHHCPRVRDLAPLKGMPLTFLNLMGCPVADLTALKGMPLTQLELNGTWVQDLTPLKGMPLTVLGLSDCHVVRDLAPLQGMPLTTLTLHHCFEVQDLTPLQGMKLTTLFLSGCGKVRDLTPLKGMPLTSLYLARSAVVDLTPLKGMPLTSLEMGGTEISDLTPLEGMKLESIYVTLKKITRGMDVLRQMQSLKTINTYEKEYPPADFWKRYDAGEFNK